MIISAPEHACFINCPYCLDEILHQQCSIGLHFRSWDFKAYNSLNFSFGFRKNFWTLLDENGFLYGG
ncbi:hypothetical protein TorRG33x02_078510 [Trema orientale]|uniref:Uncharacterized protein n=1 Tax=Trema orientale TaxID=63057 RepID=A0A2P5FEP7_TREOI|nr:hypothetical protein TorRG33x02_078510 [Trema orientale]